MMRFLISILFFSFTADVTHAGVFSAEPNDDFKNLEISVPYLGKTGLTVGDFDKGLDVKSSGGSKAWQKDSDGKWILSLVAVDKMTSKKSDIKFLFRKDDNFAVLSRLVAGGEEIPQAHLPNYALPFIEGAQKKLGRKTLTEGEREKSSCGSDDDESTPVAVAPKEVLETTLATPGNRKTAPKGKPITVGQFANYLATVGKISWHKSKTQMGKKALEIRFTPKDKEKTRYDFVLTKDAVMDALTLKDKPIYRTELYCEVCANQPKYFDSTKAFIELYTEAMKHPQ